MIGLSFLLNQDLLLNCFGSHRPWLQEVFSCWKLYLALSASQPLGRTGYHGFSDVRVFRCASMGRCRSPLASLAFRRRHFTSLTAVSALPFVFWCPIHWQNHWISCYEIPYLAKWHFSFFITVHTFVSWRCLISRNLRNSPQQLGTLDHQWCTDLYQLFLKVGLKCLGSATTLSIVLLHICCPSGKCTPSVWQSYLASTYTLWLFLNSHSHLLVCCVSSLSSSAASA